MHNLIPEALNISLSSRKLNPKIHTIVYFLSQARNVTDLYIQVELPKNKK